MEMTSRTLRNYLENRNEFDKVDKDAWENGDNLEDKWQRCLEKWWWFGGKGWLPEHGWFEGQGQLQGGKW